MPRRTANQSFYHFKAVFVDDNAEIEKVKYYLTAFDVCQDFNCCRKTIYDKVRDPLRLGRYGQFANVIIQKVKEPVYVRCPNPHLSGQDLLTA